MAERRRFRPTRGREWVGGLLTPPVFVTGGEEPYRPVFVVWMDALDGGVVGQDAVHPAEAASALGRVLLDAIARPLVGSPGRPSRVRVAEPAAVPSVRAALGPKVPVEVAPTPELDQLLEFLLASMKANPGADAASYFEEGRIPTEVVAGLFEAARLLYVLAPWRVATESQVLRMDIPALGVDGACVSIIGNLGESLGVVIFPSWDGFLAFERADLDAPGRRQAQVDLGTEYLSLNFETAGALPDAMRREAMTHGWPVADPDAYPRVERRDRDGALRPLVARDVKTATACAASLAAFFVKHRDVFEAEFFEAICESYYGEDDVEVRFTVPYEAGSRFDQEDTPGKPRPGAPKTVGRNEPCPCGSGRKYKKCHLRADESRLAPADDDPPFREIDEHLVRVLMEFAAWRLGPEWRRFADADASLQLAIPWALYGYRVRGRTVAEMYLAEQGRHASRQEKGWLAAQCAAWLSVWEVTGVDPGRDLVLRDFLSGEERRVREHTASRTLVVRDAVLARVVDHDGLSVLSGVHPRPLPPVSAAEVVRRARTRLRRKRAVPLERLRDEAFGRHLIGLWEETAAALDTRSNVRPDLRNTDGERLQPTVDHFDVAPGARAAIQARLAGWEDVEAAAFEEQSEADVAAYDFVAPADGMHAAMETKLIGRVCLSDGALRLETNSRERADRLRARLEASSRELLRHRGREHVSPFPSDRSDLRQAAPEPPRPEAERLVLEYKQRHYATWPDHPLPALGGRSPREAARTVEGREAVDLLLRDMENRERRAGGAGIFDFSGLRRELRLDEGAGPSKGKGRRGSG